MLLTISDDMEQQIAQLKLEADLQTMMLEVEAEQAQADAPEDDKPDWWNMTADEYLQASANDNTIEKIMTDEEWEDYLARLEAHR